MEAPQIGSIVRLRSGGPRMTVDAVRTDGVVEVLWFADSSLCRDAFLALTLEPCDQPIQYRVIGGWGS